MKWFKNLFTREKPKAEPKMFTHLGIYGCCISTSYEITEEGFKLFSDSADRRIQQLTLDLRNAKQDIYDNIEYKKLEDKIEMLEKRVESLKEYREKVQ